MRSILLVVCAFVLTACGAQNSQTITPGAITPKLVMVNVESTKTPVPTATIDYQATSDYAQQQVEQAKQDAYQSQQDAIQAQQAAVNAQQTSIAAGVAIAQITAQAEANQMTIVWITQSSANIIETHVAETQTAQPTHQALLSTQQSLDNSKMILQAGQLTATKEAPAILQRMSDAQNAAKFGWINYMAIGLVSIMACFLMVWIMLYLNQKPIEKIEIQNLNDDYIVPINEPITITVKTAAEYPSGNYLTVPATAEMLTEFANGIINRDKQLAVKNWEGSASQYWTRELYYPMRHFLQVNKFVQSAGGKDGRLVLLSAGEAFLRGWLDRSILPPLYTLDSNIARIPEEISLDCDSLEQENAGGVVGGYLGMSGKEFTNGTDE